MMQDGVKQDSRSPEDTRDRILLAARQVVARKGKQAATTREIASLAGVNEATLFRHFGNKDALLLALVQSCAVRPGDLLEILGRLPGTVEADLHALGRSIMDRMESVRDLMRWSIVEEDFVESILASETWRPHLAVHEMLVEYMTRRVNAGELIGEPRQLALIFLGFIFSAVLGMKKFPVDQYYGSKDACVKTFVNVFLNGVRSN